MTDRPDSSELKSNLQRVETLLASFSEVDDPALRDKLGEIVQTLLQFHGEAIARMLTKTAESETGDQLIDDFGRDELISNVLLLHGLHPVDLETRIARALESCRPYLASHGGNVELIDVSPDGAIRLRLEGSCHGCPSSRVTLQSSIEQAIYDAAPEVTAIHIEGAVEEAPSPTSGPRDGFVPLSQVGYRAASASTPD